MAVLIQIAAYLIDTFAGLYFLAVLMRFVLQLVRADFYNPISQGLVRITNPVVKPMRRIIPGILGVDVASLVVAVAIKMLALFLLLLLIGKSENIIIVLSWSLIYIVAALFNIFYIALFASIITSFVAQGSYHPIVVLSHQIGEPVLAPFRKLLPPMGGMDFTPMIAIPIFYVGRILLSSVAEASGLAAGNIFGVIMLAIHRL